MQDILRLSFFFSPFHFYRAFASCFVELSRNPSSQLDSSASTHFPPQPPAAGRAHIPKHFFFLLISFSISIYVYLFLFLFPFCLLFPFSFLPWPFANFGEIFNLTRAVPFFCSFGFSFGVIYLISELFFILFWSPDGSFVFIQIFCGLSSSFFTIFEIWKGVWKGGNGGQRSAQQHNSYIGCFT